MALATQFNLSSKTKNELKGLYVDLFNKLADIWLSPIEHAMTQAKLTMIKQALAID